MEKKEIGLYIHIPFCISKCHYCDFNSYACREDSVPAYFDALKKEVKNYSSELGDINIRTIFIGGGTPSSVDSKHIYGIMDTVSANFYIKNDAEITIESNPKTLTYEKLTDYRSMGINRLSIGLQAWQDALLEKLGRIHKAQDFIENLNLARKAGFENISADLMFALPGQTIKEWEETLNNIVKLDLDHVSCYSLTIEEGTRFGRMLEEGSIQVLEDEIDREMYYAARDILGKAGCMQYEISNFAKPGFECRHNLIYWKAEKYLGIGAGAHSYLKESRYGNIEDIDEYISAVNTKGTAAMELEEIDRTEEIFEFVMLGLRLTKGISRTEFRRRFNVDIEDIYGNKLNSLIERNLLVEEGDRIFLTSLGMDLSNEVFTHLL